MPRPAEQPRVDHPVVDRNGFATQPWIDYWLRMASSLSQDDQAVVLEELKRRIDALENGQSLNFRIIGQESISVNGVVQPNGAVIVTLRNDSDAPGNTAYYGTGPTGDKGWFPIANAITTSPTEVSRTVGPNGVVNLGLADLANTANGALLAITRDSKGRVVGTKPATITGTTNQVTVANGDAVAGLPTISLASAVLISLSKADSAVQSVVAGPGITVNNADPRNPIVSAPGSGFAPPPTDGFPYVGLNGAWERANAPDSRFWLIEYPLLTDQVGNQLTDQAGNFLMGNSPILPPGWPTSTTTIINNAATPQVVTLAQANALTGVQDGQTVLITDLSGGRELCFYDATISSGTKWRRYSDRSIAN